MKNSDRTYLTLDEVRRPQSGRQHSDTLRGRAEAVNDDERLTCEEDYTTLGPWSRRCLESFSWDHTEQIIWFSGKNQNYGQKTKLGISDTGFLEEEL